MARTMLIFIMCFASFLLFYPSASFTGDAQAETSCSCPDGCGCEHCTTGKGTCACQAKAKSSCSCPDGCGCEHCTTGKGACACQAKAKGSCACGPDCACEHCTTGKGACACGAGSGEGAAGESKGLFSLTYKGEGESIPLNTVHSWTITVTDQEGNPVTDAEIEIDGGMPAHGHGLPTEPEVTKNLGDGSYLVEGVKFSMPGEWVMTFSIKSGDKMDVVVVEFGL